MVVFVFFGIDAFSEFDDSAFGHFDKVDTAED
jgi:hypothetical protein